MEIRIEKDLLNIMKVALCEMTMPGKKCQTWFGAITDSFSKYTIIHLKNESDYNKHKDIVFEYVIMFSYYGKRHSSGTWKFRKMCSQLKGQIYVYIESNPLKDLINEPYARISIKHIMFTKQDNVIDETHFKKLYPRLTPTVQPYKNTGDILLLLQNPVQYFLDMNKLQYQNYINDIIMRVRKYSKRKIVVRYKPHTRQKLALTDPIKKLEVSNKTLHEDCTRCCICIAHSSIAVVYCVFMGLHIFSLSEYCLAHEIADTDFSALEKFNTFDREPFVKKLASSALSVKDIRKGKLVQWINNVQT